MQQAQDFYDESQALASLVTPLSDVDFAQRTQFKGWTIDQILRHLHVWNVAAGLSLQAPEAFDAFVLSMAADLKGGRLPDFEARYLDGLSGEKLRSVWIEKARDLAVAFGDADPKARLKWVGPLLPKTISSNRCLCFCCGKVSCIRLCVILNINF